MRTTATRRIQFCAGHRVYKHESKCANPHGHNYVALIEASGDLDSLGRVIDFGVLKDRLGGWIDRMWDHGFIYWQEDASIRNMLWELAGQDGRKPKVYELPTNPTAENMAAYLLNEVCPKVLARTGVTATRITLWETENCFATVSL